jgi:hypothetical protein
MQDTLANAQKYKRKQQKIRSSVPFPSRRRSLAADVFAAPPGVMACDGGFSPAGVLTGEKTNWSSEVCEMLDACDASDESDGMRRCKASRGAGSRSPLEGLKLSMSVDV